MPHGQWKKQVLGRVIPAAYRNSLLPLGLRDYYRDDDDHYYRYGDGTFYQFNRRSNWITAPALLGGA